MGLRSKTVNQISGYVLNITYPSSEGTSETKLAKFSLELLRNHFRSEL